MLGAAFMERRSGCPWREKGHRSPFGDYPDHRSLSLPSPGGSWGTGLSSTFRPRVPITLLVLTQVLGEHGPGPGLLRLDGKGAGHGVPGVCRQLAGGGLAEYRGGVLGHPESSVAMTALSQIRSASISFVSSILHTDDVIEGAYQWCGTGGGKSEIS